MAIADLELETDLAQQFFDRLTAERTAHRIRFSEDIGAQVDAHDFTLIEVIKGASPSVEPPPCRNSRHHHYDGRRLVLTLRPEDTADDAYSSVEVASTPRFTQALLDYLAATGSMRVMLPGREVVFRDVLFGDYFSRSEEANEAVTAGLCFQSWRGIERTGLTPDTYRPKFMIAWFAYVSGPGIFPMLCSRSYRKRYFFASVLDWNTGISWLCPVPDFDPGQPSDIAIRWLPNRDVEFVVDGRRVALYEDGRSRVYLPKLIRRQCSRGVNLTGYRFLTADPSQVDLWLTSMAFGNLCEVKNGFRLKQDVTMALAGYDIQPLW
jgi:hypothetical protein